MSDTADLITRIHAVESEVTAVRKALAASRNTRLLILLLLILFVVGMTWLFLGLAERVRSEKFQEALLTQAQQHLEDNSQQYANEMQKLVDSATPVLTKAVRDQFERDARKYSAAVAEQREIMVRQLRPEMGKLVENRYNTMLNGLEGVLADEFPEAKDPVIQERLQRSLRKAVSNMVKHYYLDELEEQVDQLVTVWDSFPAAEAPSPDEAPAANQLIGYMLEILSRRLTSPNI